MHIYIFIFLCARVVVFFSVWFQYYFGFFRFSVLVFFFALLSVCLSVCLSVGIKMRYKLMKLKTLKKRFIYAHVSTPGRALRSALRDPHEASLHLDLCREALVVGFWEKEEDKKSLFDDDESLVVLKRFERTRKCLQREGKKAAKKRRLIQIHIVVFRTHSSKSSGS